LTAATPALASLLAFAASGPQPARLAVPIASRLRTALACAALALLCAGAGACSRFVILHDPLTAEEHNDLGVVYQAAGKPELARRAYRRALSKKPDFVVARVNLGNLDAAAERWNAAERSYRRALRDAPDDAHALNNLAWVLYRRGGDLDEAERLSRRALTMAGASDTTFTRTLDAILEARARTR
jgi:tetratricopeptide (TPR) repeat protein